MAGNCAALPRAGFSEDKKNGVIVDHPLAKGMFHFWRSHTTHS